MRLINPERLIEDKGFFIEDERGGIMCVVSAQDIRNAPNVKLVPAVFGYWIKHGTGENAYVECSECHVCGNPAWKVCPVCETKMEDNNG